MSTEHIIHFNDFFYEYEINHFRVKLNKNYYKIRNTKHKLKKINKT